jgi:hypothetical protein
MDIQSNRSTFSDKHAQHMRGELTDSQFYLWFAEFIGVDASYLPVDADTIHASTEPDLSDIPLILWDSRHPFIQAKAAFKGLSCSSSDSVSMLKAIAKTI